MRADDRDEHRVTLTVNGVVCSLVVEGRKHLADVLRDDLGLTGTHLGCEHGVCGSCTVAMDGAPVRACLVLGVQADGRHVETIEGLAEAGGEMGLVQRAMWEKHAFQCAFCAPGMMITTKCLLAANPRPTQDEIVDGLAGNLCRCTGYHSIVAGVYEAVTMLADGGHGDA